MANTGTDIDAARNGNLDEYREISATGNADVHIHGISGAGFPPHSDSEVDRQLLQLDFTYIGTSDPDVHSLLEDMSSGYIQASAQAPGRFAPRLIANAGDDTMKDALDRELSACDSFDISVAFISKNALQSLLQPFLDSARNTQASNGVHGPRRIITSTKSYFNDPGMFRYLLHLKDVAGIDVRIWQNDDDSPVPDDEPFHPKGYIFARHTANGREYYDILVGSSNLTDAALGNQKEWNLKVSSFENGELARQLRRELDDQIMHSVELTQDWIRQYEGEFAEHQIPRQKALEEEKALQNAPIEPNSMQREALASLARLRAQGERRAIIISATGTGKTYLSAFDVRAFHPRRMLYLAHQQQILTKAEESYRRVLGCPAGDIGLLSGTSKEGDRTYVFATIQTMSRDDVLRQYQSDEFDYILFDEVHHAGAASYQKVLDHFSGAKFILGMTATPERTDGVNIFNLFGNNIAYEIRLGGALDAGLLCPFHYYGVTEYCGAPIENADGSIREPNVIAISDGKNAKDTAALNEYFSLDELTSKERVKYIISMLNRYGDPSQQVTGLVFCSRQEEAWRLSSLFNEEWNEQVERNYRTAAVTSSDEEGHSISQGQRQDCIDRLERGELDYLFTVDLFNEGVDIPALNQIVMLRNTQSSIIFTQQLGRGLRRFPHKTSVTVIDFIGNYANNYLIPLALYGNSGDKETARRHVTEHHPGASASSIHFDDISRKRILDSLDRVNLSEIKRLRESYRNVRYQLGAIPMLTDLYRSDASLPIAIGRSSADSYLDFVRGSERNQKPLNLRGTDITLDTTSEWEDKVLKMLTAEILSGIRPQEAMILCALCGFGLPDDLGGRLALATPSMAATDENAMDHSFTRAELMGLVSAVFPDADVSDAQFDNAMHVLDYSFYREGTRKNFGGRELVVHADDGGYHVADDLRQSLRGNPVFRAFFRDTVFVSLLLCRDAYDAARKAGRRQEHGFLYEHQYRLMEIMRLCCWAREENGQNVGGYKRDEATGTMPIMVKYNASQYQDTFIGTQDMTWYSKDRRRVTSPEFAWIGDCTQPDWDESHFIPLFVMRKADAEGKDASRYFYVGHVAGVFGSRDTTRTGSDGKPVNVVLSTLHLADPLTPGLYEYLTGRRE